MKRYTKRILSRMANECDAENVTYENPGKFRNEKMECIGTSFGTYGICAALFFSRKQNRFFYVKERTTTLLALI